MTRSPRTFTTTATASTPRAFSLTASRHVEQYPNNLSTNSKTKTDKYEADSPHAVQDKIKQGDTYNVQEANAKAGMDSAHKQGTGGHATERMDSAGGKAKAKKEFPEAPDPAIGMQDERGGRGA
ncbi:hypothetical protein DDE82_006854 [Stemphylium lycopersici]|uniref:Uncharacterized protein n=1 Tax=Stemphylium lycopersici TaxID=183478 RepID=A0A364ND66_STELY|nr:hypothetical protein TW65_07542 [Stemphylium lycopersici]RAR00963.1 hypothetical protein DDE82_006854 [Stemphylium lycopersici]RAR15258.1 hypothetical protein DDE83_001292 [Stemphylium lycopersici]